MRDHGLFSDLAGLVAKKQTRKDLVLYAETLIRAAHSGNLIAIQEIEEGLKNPDHWDLGGLIEKDSKPCEYVLRDVTKEITPSGPMPLGAISRNPLAPKNAIGEGPYA